MSGSFQTNTAPPPPELYHYTSYGGYLGILRTRCMWASLIHCLNDSREFAHGIELANDVLSDRRGDTHNQGEQAFLADLESEIRLIKSTNIFVASFSEVPDLLSQWRGYCPPNKGLSIGFETDLLLRQAVAQEFCLARVEYDRDRQAALVAALIEDAFEEYRVDPNLRRPTAYRFGSKFAALSPLLKDVAFAEEREWRLISAVTSSTHAQVSMRDGPTRIVAYFSFSLANAPDQLRLGTITVGPTPEPGLTALSIQQSYYVYNVDGGAINKSTIPFRPW